MNVSQQLDEAVQARHLASLERQNASLLAQVKEMRALIETIPGIIVEARLDAKQGIQTKYDYARHSRVTAESFAFTPPENS